MNKFGNLSPKGQRLAILGIAASVGVVAAAQRDLNGRTAADVRGSKLAWRVISLNALGALGYLRWGRRPAP